MSKYLYLSAKIKVPELESCPSAGSRGNITGMRKLYWGKEAYIVKQGNYIYKVSQNLFLKCQLLNNMKGEL